MTAPVTVSTVRWMFAFQEWATGNVLAAAADSDLRQPGLIAGGDGDGSVHDALAHVVAAEWIWLQRWLGESGGKRLRGHDFADTTAIRALLDRVRDVRGQWLASLTDDALAAPDGPGPNGAPLWQMLSHVANHSTHHRAEACAALTGLGRPPSGVDLLDFIRLGLAPA